MTTNNTPEEIKEIEDFQESQKKHYFNRLEEEMLLMVENIKNTYALRDVHTLDFSLDIDTNEPYLFVYCFDKNKEEIEGLMFDHTISISGDEINYLMDRGINFEFELNVKCNKETLLLNLAKEMMGADKGSFWYGNRKSTLMYEKLQAEIPAKADVKKKKI